MNSYIPEDGVTIHDRENCQCCGDSDYEYGDDSPPPPLMLPGVEAGGAERSASAASYVPEGGVWTAEEREDAVSLVKTKHGHHYEFSLAILAAANTVSALIRALEDQHSKLSEARGVGCKYWTGKCDVCALLAALKGEKS